MSHSKRIPCDFEFSMRPTHISLIFKLVTWIHHADQQKSSLVWMWILCELCFIQETMDIFLTKFCWNIVIVTAPLLLKMRSVLLHTIQLFLNTRMYCVFTPECIWSGSGDPKTNLIHGFLSNDLEKIYFRIYLIQIYAIVAHLCRQVLAWTHLGRMSSHL